MRKLLLLFIATVFMCSISMLAQTKTITGKVTDADDGAPIPGAAVMVKGTSIGTVTNAEGVYSLQVPSDAQSIMVTYLGMEGMEEQIQGRSTINFAMRSDIKNVDEVVVVGYGVQRKKDVTSSISQVKGSDLAEIASPSFLQQLAGRASGVQITQSSGDLGTPPNIRIRGVNTISSGSQPLVVVNGVPVTSGNIGGSYTNNNPMADINPSDIESIEILKDGAATSIFGSRASNGVILITTKKGSQQKTVVSYDTWFAFSKASKLYDLLDGQEFVTIANEKYKNEGSVNQPAKMDDKGTSTNWNDYVFRTGFQHSHSLSVAGGTDKTKYYLSAGYSKQEGIVINNNLSRYTINSSVDQSIGKYLKVGFSMNGSYQKNNGPIKGQNSISDNMYATTRMLPNVEVYSDTHPTGFNIDASSPKSLGRGANTQPIDLTVPNIVWVLKNNVQTNESYRLMPTAYAEINPIKGLSLKTLVGADVSLLDNLYAWDPASGDGFGYKGLINQSNYTRKRWTYQNIGSYVTSIDNHNIDVTAVAEYSKYEYKYVNAGAREMSSDFFMPNIISNTYITQSSGGDYDYNGIASYIFRANYNYNSIYYLGGSIRKDGLSKLPKDNRWGTFYGMSLAVRLSELGFWKPIHHIVNDFRIRGSVAQVGNDDIGNFTYLDQFSPQQYGSQVGISYSQIGNPNLKWEKQDIVDIGFDFSLFNRINVVAAYWQKKNTDIVLLQPTPPSLGVPSNQISMNVGAVKNDGLEFEVNASIIRNKNFSYNASLNFSTQNNKVTELVADMKYEHYIIRKGESMRSLYGYQYEGVNMQNGYPLYKKADGTIIQGNPFDSKYYEYNANDPATLGKVNNLTADDKKILGNTIPKWFGGFDNNITFKNFDMNIFFRFSGGNKVANVTRRDMLNMQFQNNGREILGRWQSVNNPGNGNVPIIIYGKGSFLNLEADGSSRWVEDGDFLKLQNLAIGYTLPKNLMSKIGIAKMRIYVQGQNLLTITDYSGLDPEIYTGSVGIDWNGNPQQRTFTFGANVTF